MGGAVLLTDVHLGCRSARNTAVISRLRFANDNSVRSAKIISGPIATVRSDRRGDVTQYVTVGDAWPGSGREVAGKWPDENISRKAIRETGEPSGRSMPDMSTSLH